MAYFAQFNPGLPDPKPITGWYDTSSLAYSNMPSASELIEIGEADWVFHFTQPHGWFVVDGKIREPL